VIMAGSGSGMVVPELDMFGDGEDCEDWAKSVSLRSTDRGTKETRKSGWRRKGAHLVHAINNAGRARDTKHDGIIEVVRAHLRHFRCTLHLASHARNPRPYARSRYLPNI
jgi:hypothetical protein